MSESVDKPDQVARDDHLRFEDTYLALMLRRVAPTVRRVVVACSVLALGVPALVLMLRTARALDARLSKRSAPETMPVSQPPAPLVQSHYEQATAIQRPEPARRSIPSPMGSIQPIEDRPARSPATLLSPAVTAPPATSVNVIIPAGLMLTVALAEDLATDTNHEGDVFHAVLMEDLESEGRVVAPGKSKVRGRIMALRHGDRTENPRFTLALESLVGVSGPVSLNTDQLVVEGRRQSKVKRILGGVGGAISREIAGRSRTSDNLEIEPIVPLRGDILVLPAGSVGRFHLQNELRVALRQ